MLLDGVCVELVCVNFASLTQEEILTRLPCPPPSQVWKDRVRGHLRNYTVNVVEPLFVFDTEWFCGSEPADPPWNIIWKTSRLLSFWFVFLWVLSIIAVYLPECINNFYFCRFRFPFIGTQNLWIAYKEAQYKCIYSLLKFNVWKCIKYVRLEVRHKQ